jgi:hypothetical protein
VGYGFREAAYEVESQSGLKLRDLVSLHWVPLSLGPRISFRLPGIRFVKPSFWLGGGAQWLQQGGKLDGITQGFWVPFYGGSACLKFLNQTESGSHWFGGISLGGTMSRSFSSQQTVSYWSMDFATTLLF